MRNRKGPAIVVAVFTLLFLTSGCSGVNKIKVEYLPGFDTQNWFGDRKQTAAAAQPLTIAVNALWDERTVTDKIGDSYNKRNEKVETLVASRNPAAIVEDALIRQLRQAGFKVVRTTGWDLSTAGIPELAKVDFILGGRLKVFWVEAHSGYSTVAINSKVAFDLVIADVKSKKLIWAGQFVGVDAKEATLKTDNALRASISRSLTQAVNKVFQDQAARTAVLTLVRVKF